MLRRGSRCTVGATTVELDVDDTVMFQAHAPHRYACLGDEPVRFSMVVLQPGDAGIVPPPTSPRPRSSRGGLRQCRAPLRGVLHGRAPTGEHPVEQEVVHVGLRVRAAVAQHRDRVVAIGRVDERCRTTPLVATPARAISSIPRARRIVSRSVPTNALPRRLGSTGSAGNGAMSGWIAVRGEDSWNTSPRVCIQVMFALRVGTSAWSGRSAART